MKGRRVSGITALLTIINRKQIPLCCKHHKEFEKGIYTQVDFEYLKSLYNVGKIDADSIESNFCGKSNTAK